MALVLAKWGPVILQCLPHIIRAVHHLYSLWCTIRGKSRHNNAVVRAMNLLIKHENDVNGLLQNPGLKRELLEGLAILINKINQSNRGEVGNNGNNMMVSGLLPSCPSPSALMEHSKSSFEDYGAASVDKCKSTRWKTCDVCLCEYDFSDKKPAILICGHTFCQVCLRETFRRNQSCPTCRQRETRPLDSIPLNVELLRLLESDQEENKGDESSFNGSGCKDIPLSYEQQIQFAIFLSQQEAESQGAECVEARWKELECAGDEWLANAIQVSEFYEDSRLCAQRKQSESALNIPDKEEKEVCGAETCEEGEEASLRLALQLHQEEIEWIQKNGNNGSNEEDGHWRNQYHSINSSSCAPVEEDRNMTQEQDKSDVREKEEDKDEGDGAMCYSNKQDEEKCTEGEAISCSRRQDEGKKDDDKEECQISCIEEDCEEKVCKEECLALMKSQEDALVELAIQLSLKNCSD